MRRTKPEPPENDIMPDPYEGLAEGCLFGLGIVGVLICIAFGVAAYVVGV